MNPPFEKDLGSSAISRLAGISLLTCLGVVGILFASTRSSRPSWPTLGGEGGRIISVTTLSDRGPGSFRAAVEAEGPRIIQFAVGGEIWLERTLEIRNPFVTIAAETAPSPGITLMGDQIRIRTHDILMRHLRVRVGSRLKGPPPDNRDALAIDGGADGLSPSYKILIENCSFSWSTDEIIQIWGPGNHDITVRHCILAEALNLSLHPKGAHSAGMIIGPGATNVLIQRNLFASNAFRNPVICSGSTGTILNNLIYNPGFSGVHVYGRDGDLAQTKLLVNIIGNQVIAGPDTKPILRLFQNVTRIFNLGSEIFLKDNAAQGTVSFDETERPPSWISRSTSPFVQKNPIPILESLPMIASSEVETDLLTHVGARPQDRDAVDLRIIEEVKHRTGSIKDTPTDPRLTEAPAPHSVSFKSNPTLNRVP